MPYQPVFSLALVKIIIQELDVLVGKRSGMLLKEARTLCHGGYGKAAKGQQ